MLKRLLARLGAEEVARRLGVTPATVRRWAKVGVPPKRAAQAKGVAKRSDAARKAARSRKDAERAAALAAEQERARRQAEDEAARRRRAAKRGWRTRRKKFRDGLQPPERAADLPGDLDPEDVLPEAPPTRDLVHDSDGFAYEGQRSLDTERYTGTITTFTIGRPAADVSPDEIADKAISVWDVVRRVYCFVRFLFFRYIPKNPFYKDRDLVAKQGTWVDWWGRTATAAKAAGAADPYHVLRTYTRNVFEGYTKYEGGHARHVKGAHEAAEERVIWLEQIQVNTFSDKETTDYTRMTKRRLHAS